VSIIFFGLTFAGFVKFISGRIDVIPVAIPNNENRGKVERSVPPGWIL
jgi:hypothetical protein